MGEHIVGGRYRLLSVLGRLARITTYEAETTDARERVVVRGFPTPDDATARTVELEAAARARLVHPALPKVREHLVDSLNGVRGRFLVEERVPGAETATAAIARRGVFPEVEVAAIARALLGALETLHANGFTHPDLSPDHVLLAPGGRVVLVDWGPPPNAKRAPSSPELPKGDLTRANDLRALGTTLALLAIGRAAEPTRVLDEMRTHAPRLAAWTAQLVADPPYRFAGAREALDALNAATRESFWRTVPRWAFVVAAAVPVLFVLLVVTALLVARAAAKTRTDDAAAAVERDRKERSAQLASLTATNMGCADGTREAFKDILSYPGIAGCAGAFKVPGVLAQAAPSCGRAAGNDGANPLGSSCSASDLCAEHFHVCAGATEVAARAPDGCRGARDAPPMSFFATRQGGVGNNECATGEDTTCEIEARRPGCAPNPDFADDLFGCGTSGVGAKPSCAPLDRTSGDLCGAIGSSLWHCRGGDHTNEARVVTKPELPGGGVLCCED